MTIDAKPAATGRRAVQKQDRRQAIIAAARRSFLQEGYAATSMSGLLKTLGGSKATLWSYFRSKEELFAAVIEDVTMAFRAALDEELSSTDGLENTLLVFCRSFMSKISSPDALATWRLVAAESGRFPEIGRIFYERGARHTQSALASFLSHHIALGHLRDEDATRMADMLTNLCTGQQNRLLWGISTPDPATIEQNAVEFTRCFLRVYRTDGEQGTG